MVKESYSGTLKSPLWQKKRLDILNRDNFTCTLCSDTETELHIHHKEYRAGKKPWEYEDENFQTLCKHCHQVVEAYKDCHIKAIVSGKNYNSKTKDTLVSTILYHEVDGFILSITEFPDYGEPKHLLLLDKKPFNQISELFIHAEKLIK